MADTDETLSNVPDPEPEVQTNAQIVAAKSADVDKAESNRHVKVFVLPPGPKPTPANGYDHEANKAATVQYMLSQGMRPVGEVRHVSTKQHRNGASWVLTYDVEAVPTRSTHGPSEPHVVTGGDGAEVNTEGTGHSDDTSDKASA